MLFCQKKWYKRGVKYDEWIDGIFNREQLNQYDLDWDEDFFGMIVSLPSNEVLGLIAETFARAGEDLRLFSDEQVALGLKFITGEGTGLLLYKFYEVDASTSERLAVINNIYVLYRDCLALRCSNDPEEVGNNPLDSYAHMFWDAGALSVFGVLRRNVDNKEELVEAILNVLENTLQLSNATCQKAAIHGLGHSIDYVASDWLQRIRKIIDRYCALSTTNKYLKKYARQARTGMIL
jgi:hypothetical protein